MKTLRVAVAGINGRMGRALAEVLAMSGSVDERAGVQTTSISAVQLVAGSVSPASGLAGTSLSTLTGVELQAGKDQGSATPHAVCSLQEVVGEFDVLIDFTSPGALAGHLALCVKHRKALVVGTTGLSESQKTQLRQAGQTIPVLHAPNMSIGINLLERILGEVTRKLGAAYDVEIIEAHHRFKKDAPSGTALRLGEVVAEAMGQTLSTCAVYGREGISESRRAGEIGFETIRAGDIIGDHTVLFASLGERLEFTHRATSRRTFAEGAVRAALWLGDRQPGFYNMADVLGE